MFTDHSIHSHCYCNLLIMNLCVFKSCIVLVTAANYFLCNSRSASIIYKRWAVIVTQHPIDGWFMFVYCALVQYVFCGRYMQQATGSYQTHTHTLVQGPCRNTTCPVNLCVRLFSYVLDFQVCATTCHY